VSEQAPLDAGNCPDGTVLSAENGNQCFGSPICVPGFAPACGQQDRCSTQGEENPVWDVIYAQLDAGGSRHVCYEEPPP
jgi:hypothetical protein